MKMIRARVLANITEEFSKAVGNEAFAEEWRRFVDVLLEWAGYTREHPWFEDDNRPP